MKVDNDDAYNEEDEEGKEEDEAVVASTTLETLLIKVWILLGFLKMI